MKKQNDFVKAGRAHMDQYIRKAIDDLLFVLDSPVEYPTDKYGYILIQKLFPIVQSRENVWISCTELMDMADIDKSANKKYLDKIVTGFQTTWVEMTKIVQMDIGQIRTEQMPDFELTEGEIRELARENVTDDKLTSISKAKVLAAKLSYQILERIDRLVDPEGVSESDSAVEMTSIIEMYVEN